MGRYKFENLLKAFLISKQQSYLSIRDGKIEMITLKLEVFRTLILPNLPDMDNRKVKRHFKRR